MVARGQRTAFVLGGNGLIGRALVPALAEAGYAVTVMHRGDHPVAEPVAAAAARLATGDREDDDALAAAMGEPDVVVDVIPMRPAHSDQLLRLRARFGSLVAVSSGAVYADRTGAPALGCTDPDGVPCPIGEEQRTVAPDDETYPGRKAGVEQRLLACDGLPVTVVRPGAIYGPGDRASREWFFVKRVLDGRRRVVLAGNGESRFHQTASANLAALIVRACERPATRVLNAGDDDCLTVAQTAAAVAAAMGHEWETVLLPEPAEDGGVGDTPWSTRVPIVYDVSAAHALGHRDVVDRQDAIGEACTWAVEATRGRDWREVLPQTAAYYGALFDYAAEDAV
jgi:nucleoside-diphosphate-sugar epimerase